MRKWINAEFLAVCFTAPALAQRRFPASFGATSLQQEKRFFGIIPNYRTTPFVLAALYAAEGQAARSSASFGQKPGGYARYFAASYADWAGGDFMTEGIYPALLHQDPRYFRKGTGSAIKRLTYAMGQIFWTHTDTGGHMFNFSEVCGNATMAAISQAYYPDNRDARSAASALAIQMGDDMASNILKEFYPDLRRWLSRKHGAAGLGSQH